MSLLGMWCAVKARANTTHLPKEPTDNGPVPGARVSPYNAAASVNMAFWLFFWVWLANTSVIVPAPSYNHSVLTAEAECEHIDLNTSYRP